MKIIMISIFAILGGIILLAAGMFIYARSQLRPLDDEARAQAPGDFIDLSQGKTHYQFFGEGSKPVIVFVHGFSTPSFVWRGIVPLLREAGFRILTYDLYGRGWSARPDARHNAELYERQLSDLLAAKSIKGRIVLVGYSMGGAIAAHYAANHPEKIAGLVLIAPAGLSVNEDGAALFQWPLIGDWLMAVRGRHFMLDMMARPENQGRAVPDIVARYAKQMEYDGYLTALLSALRHFPLGAMEAEYQSVGRGDFPVLAIWGRQDSVVPVSNIDRIKRFVPRAQFAVKDGASHAITYSEPEFVAQSISDFLNHLNAQ